jgi:hypothetical protein
MNLGPNLPDFDTLVSLHRQDPEAFEHFRRLLLREAVDAAPADYQPTLDRLLSDIERRREAAATPIEAVIAASRAMTDSLEQLVGGWGRARVAVAEWQTAEIIRRFRK